MGRPSRFPRLPRTDVISPDLPFCIVSRPSQVKYGIPVVTRYTGRTVSGFVRGYFLLVLSSLLKVQTLKVKYNAQGGKS